MSTNADDWAAVKSVLDHRRTGRPSERFPRHVVSKPAAKRLCQELGIKMPRAGWEVTLATDPDGARWHLSNVAGSSFYLWSYR